MQHAKLTATDGITQGINVPTPPEKNTTCQHMVCTICFLVFAFFATSYCRQHATSVYSDKHAAPQLAQAQETAMLSQICLVVLF
jgi:hypothetical protein